MGVFGFKRGWSRWVVGGKQKKVERNIEIGSEEDHKVWCLAVNDKSGINW